MRAIRAAAKAEDPDSVVIVEQWGDSSQWLLGDQGDSTMDYRFRRAVIGLVNGATADLDGSIDAAHADGVRQGHARACRRTTRPRRGTRCCTWSTATTRRASCGR